ncbi:dihydropteroate synthase [Sulfitobacter sp. S190]|uniref:dihydropteroate synthase n=1 Tax=Sulfitobacter sp. S190 TaxID=2867022 RepID=UPI0021A5701E|nr:dihydropteroate synthase [Sulfitobacter sp. S190]UWR24197.1 dihydropteroate synthase [Sulfitobacter sp. S190]
MRPLVQGGRSRPSDALVLAGGWGWFTHVEVLSRTAPPQVIAARDASAELTGPRAPLAGLTLDRPRIMGIVNTTPDSFSDGGKHAALDDAVAGGLAMAAAGADVLDIGGESTRPGAHTVDSAEEIARTAPVIAGLRAASFDGVISIDTRKSSVASAALSAGATLINDVSGFTYDPDLAGVAAQAGVPVCVMHAQGDPATMQRDPTYKNVVLDVYDHLARRLDALEAVGIPRDRIMADPGIGFGKTQAHNLALLERLGVLHGLGVALLLGASRKRFIGTIGGADAASDRAPGSIAVALAGIAQGVQMVRVHDVAETRQALALWQASVSGQA